MERNILCINFGSTSTKLAIYKENKCFAEKSINHETDEIASFDHINDQLPMRLKAVDDFLAENNMDASSLDAVSARAGVTPPVEFGAYGINDCMLDRLLNKPIASHAMNLSAIVAYELKKKNMNLLAITYDSCTTDQMEPIYKFSGIPEITRSHMSHVENLRAVAFKTAEKLGKKYEELTLITAHLGGGFSSNIHHSGRIIDSIDSNSGAFSPERSGILPSLPLAKLIYSGKMDQKELLRRLEGNGGMVAYLGTSDARDVEKSIVNGDAYAENVYHAMAVQVAKQIGELSTDVCGKVDAIVLTGGLSHSSLFTAWISERVSFIAPVYTFPGEYEMEALASGALRVLNGAEPVKEYKED